MDWACSSWTQERHRGKVSLLPLRTELVDGACEGIIPIDEIRHDNSPDGLFTTIVDVSDPVRTGSLLGNFLFLVVKQLQGIEGMVDIGPRQTRTGSTAIVSGGR